MILELFDAFRSIGINDEAARKAAGALSDNPQAIADLRSEMKDEFGKVRDEFAKVRSEMKDEFAKVRSEMKDEFAKVRVELGQLRTEQVVVRTLFALQLAGLLSVIVKLYF